MTAAGTCDARGGKKAGCEVSAEVAALTAVGPADTQSGRQPVRYGRDRRGHVHLGKCVVVTLKTPVVWSLYSVPNFVSKMS